MAHEWIKAGLARHYVSQGDFDYQAAMRICERAHSGLIAAKAEIVIWQGQEKKNCRIPKGFWWAEGHEALTQNWEAGDFTTWIDNKIEVKVFGVSFDFVALSQLVPADRQATALRTISVIAEEDWLSSQEVMHLMYDKFGPNSAAGALLEACALGQIAARAMRASGEGGSDDSGWAAIEWDVPLWFWRGFSDAASSTRDWILGKVQGRGVGPAGSDFIKLQGVHFHRSGLANLGLQVAHQASDPAPAGKRGRRPEYDWPAASTAIWGQLVRGELIPTSQAQIEVALQTLLAKGDKEPSESSVRPHAKAIWEEFVKA